MDLAMARGFGAVGFAELNEMETTMVDGGVNWDRVFAGTTAYLGVIVAIATATSPIGLVAGAAYVGIAGASSGYIAYGFLTN